MPIGYEVPTLVRCFVFPLDPPDAARLRSAPFAAPRACPLQQYRQLTLTILWTRAG